MIFNEDEVKNMTLDQIISLTKEEKLQIVNVYGNFMQIYNNGMQLFQLFDVFVMLEGLSLEELKFNWALRPMAKKYGIDINYSLDLLAQN